MMYVACRCGSGVGLPDDFVGERAECPDCGQAFAVVAGPGAEVSGSDSLDARLTVRSGSGRVGEQFVLRGDQPIEIGKLADKPISLPGRMVSRTHCQLVRDLGCWRVEDLNSTNGTFVDENRVAGSDLRDGDVLRIGDYELVYSAHQVEAERGAYELTEAPRPVRAMPLPPLANPGPSVMAALSVDPCPSCGKYLPANAIICVNCGINLRTGRALLVSDNVDEESIRENAAKAIRAVSFFVPVGLYPVASDGYGSQKPYAVWAIAALTTLVTILVWVADLGGGSAGSKNLMLWAGREPTAHDIIEGWEINKDTHWGDRLAFDHKLAELQLQMPRGEAIEAAYKQLDPSERCFGEFHFYQLITNGLLHGGIEHLAGNLLFLLVLGSRVNALIGQWRTAVLYVVLLIVASWAEMLSLSHGPMRPALGASGAIMGLAGIYFVVFPVHRVFLAIWIRFILWIFVPIVWSRAFLKVFAVRGFWLVLTIVSLDVLATLLPTQDGVAHWAHLGGFMGGMAVALALLLTRQIDPKGGDLISAILGKRAWALLGKPAARNAPTPAAAAV